MALLLQILLYIAFLVVLIYPMLARTQVGPSHDTHAGLVQSLVDRRFDAEDAPDGTCSFREINSPLQFHRWVRGPLLQELFSPSDYNGLPLPMSQQALVRGSHQLVGGVRLRQFRVRNDSCTVAPGFRRALAPHGCFAMYSLDRRDTAHFGAGEAVEGFHYHPGTPLSSFSFIARDALYDTGGFSAELPPERGLAQMVLDNLEAGGWVDRSTRAVVLTFNLLNVNYNVLTAARMVRVWACVVGMCMSASVRVSLHVWACVVGMCVSACVSSALRVLHSRSRWRARAAGGIFAFG